MQRPSCSSRRMTPCQRAPRHGSSKACRASSSRREEFERRLRERFYDPAFQQVEPQIADIIAVAWEAYDAYRKSPRTRPAGPGFADPSFELPIEWLETREHIQQAEREQKDASRIGRILLVCGAARHDQTCPGEMSKTFRSASLAREEVELAGLQCDLLDLSLMTAQYGRQILPCKACVATAMPLCHWPCSCYPNHAMGQVVDWMNEIIDGGSRRTASTDRDSGLRVPGTERVEAHDRPSGVRRWRQSGLNDDAWEETGRGQGAPARRVVVSEAPRGTPLCGGCSRRHRRRQTLRRSLADWLSDMKLLPAMPQGGIDRYIGYYGPGRDEPRSPRRRRSRASGNAQRSLELGGARAADSQRPCTSRRTRSSRHRARSDRRRRSRCERVLRRVLSVGGPPLLTSETPAATTPRRT